MRITEYNTMIDRTTNLNILVAKSSIDYPYDSLNKPELIVSMMNDIYNLSELAEEYLYMIAFDTKFKVTGIFEISHGTVNRSFVNIRGILIRAVLSGAVNIVIVHNHPSGDIAYSREDLSFTQKLEEVFDLMELSLKDSIIIGNQKFFSFQEEGLLKNPHVHVAHGDGKESICAA